jgi:hypothetical protein
VVRRAGRLAAVAEPAQIRRHDDEPLGQARRDTVPHQVRLGDAVQQQDGRSLPAPDAVDRRAGRGDVIVSKPANTWPRLRR